MFVVEINNTNPLFFYCGQVGHCMAGMFGVVNPSGDQTLEAYSNAVKSIKSASAASGVFGGQFMANVDSSSGASSGATSASSTGTATSATTTGTTTGTGTGTTTTAGGATTTSSAATSASSSVVPSAADESIIARGRAAAYVTVGMVLLSAFVAGLLV